MPAGCFFCVILAIRAELFRVYLAGRFRKFGKRQKLYLAIVSAFLGGLYGIYVSRSGIVEFVDFVTTHPLVRTQDFWISIGASLGFGFFVVSGVLGIFQVFYWIIKKIFLKILNSEIGLAEQAKTLADAQRRSNPDVSGVSEKPKKSRKPRKRSLAKGFLLSLRDEFRFLFVELIPMLWMSEKKDSKPKPKPKPRKKKIQKKRKPLDSASDSGKESSNVSPSTPSTGVPSAPVITKEDVHFEQDPNAAPKKREVRKLKSKAPPKQISKKLQEAIDRDNAGKEVLRLEKLDDLAIQKESSLKGYPDGPEDSPPEDTGDVMPGYDDVGGGDDLMKAFDEALDDMDEEEMAAKRELEEAKAMFPSDFVDEEVSEKDAKSSDKNEESEEDGEEEKPEVSTEDSSDSSDSSNSSEREQVLNSEEPEQPSDSGTDDPFGPSPELVKPEEKPKEKSEEDSEGLEPAPIKMFAEGFSPEGPAVETPEPPKPPKPLIVKPKEEVPAESPVESPMESDDQDSHDSENSSDPVYRRDADGNFYPVDPMEESLLKQMPSAEKPDSVSEPPIVESLPEPSPSALDLEAERVEAETQALLEEAKKKRLEKALAEREALLAEIETAENLPVVDSEPDSVSDPESVLELETSEIKLVPDPEPEPEPSNQEENDDDNFFGV